MKNYLEFKMIYLKIINCSDVNGKRFIRNIGASKWESISYFLFIKKSTSWKNITKISHE